MDLKPSECFSRNVEGPWELYKNDPGCEWKAVCAARAVNAHAEWLFQYYSKHDQSRLDGAGSVNEFRRQHSDKCQDIWAVKNIADGGAHRFLNPSKYPRGIHTSTDALFEQGNRLIYRPDGRDFLEIMRNTVNFWREWPD